MAFLILRSALHLATLRMLRKSCTSLFRATAPAQMKIMVGVKSVVDYTVKVRVKDNKVVLDGVKMSVNPFCEIAIEEALRLKEKKIAAEVVAVLIGSAKAEEQLRSALALGCDDAIHVIVPPENAASLEPLAVAQILAKLHETHKPDIWILGKQAIDGDFGTTPPMLAGLINASQATCVSVVEVANKKIKATRDIDAGRQEVEMTTPAVLAADLRLNTPRFAKLPNIMKARKHPIKKVEVASLGVDIAPHLVTLKVEEPKGRSAGVKVKDAEELYAKLKNDAKVL